MRDTWAALTGRRAIESAAQPWSDVLSAHQTATGLSVSPEGSLRMAAVYAGVRLLAESVSSLPVDVIRQQGNRRVTVDGPVARLVTEQPNPEMDAPELWRTVMGWMLLRGNAYLYIERDRDGRPVGLWPLPFDLVQVGRDTQGALYYQLASSLDSTEVSPRVPAGPRLGPESVLHYKAFGVGGLYGLSPIQQVREAVATSLAAQSYMGRFYRNDARPGGVIQVEGELSDEQFDRLQRQWRAQHEGLSRSHLMAILEGGAKWESVGLDPGDAQFIETQKWQTTEIARALGIPPHMIGDVERSTSWGTGIAEQGIAFVTYTLTPWITRLEWVTRQGLLAGLDRRLRPKWRVEGLQRGDAQARYNAYAIGRQWGWLSVNDVRSLEDLDPVDNGDVYLQPLNMVPAGSAPPARSGRRGRQDNHDPVETQREALAADMAGFVQRQRQVITEALGMRSLSDVWDAERWDTELTIVVDRHAQQAASAAAAGVLDRWNPDRQGWSVEVMQAYIAEMAGTTAARINRDLYVQLNAALASGDGIDELLRVFDVAENTTDANAGAVTAEAAGFGSHDAAAASGLRTKTWRTTSRNPRAEHARLNGETVAIGDEFSNGLRWPGDSRGTEDKTAGCRCRLDYGRGDV